MKQAQRQSDRRRPAVEAHLLGVVDFDACLALQQRLVYEAGDGGDDRVTLLICEHAPLITVGRSGSRSAIRPSDRSLECSRLGVRWVNRGGGCVVHAPGQLAVYPIVPLQRFGWTVGEYLERLQSALEGAMAEARFHGERRPDELGLWGRTGQVAAVGAAVKNWVAYYGAYVNVQPPARLLRTVSTDGSARGSMSSLVAEAGRHVKITQVREALVRHVASALDCDRCHLITGHVWLRPRPAPAHEHAARVG